MWKNFLNGVFAFTLSALVGFIFIAIGVAQIIWDYPSLGSIFVAAGILAIVPFGWSWATMIGFGLIERRPKSLFKFFID